MILRGWFAIELSIGWQELEEYLNMTEKYLRIAKSHFETSANERAKELSAANPDLRADEIDDILSNEYWDYAETFPRIFRSSFFVSAYSLLEHKMAFICRQLQEDKGLPLSWSDLKGNTLEQFKLYCKLADLELSYNSETWQEIQHYCMLRNCIVHNRGLVHGARQERELQAYASRKNIVEDLFVGLSTRSQPQIALTAEFCKEVTKTIWAFLSKVLEVYELQRQNQKADG